MAAGPGGGADGTDRGVCFALELPTRRVALATNANVPPAQDVALVLLLLLPLDPELQLVQELVLAPSLDPEMQ